MEFWKVYLNSNMIIREIGLNETWFETAKICKMYAREDIQTIETIMEDAYVCKSE